MERRDPTSDAASDTDADAGTDTERDPLDPAGVVGGTECDGYPLLSKQTLSLALVLLAAIPVAPKHTTHTLLRNVALSDQ